MWLNPTCDTIGASSSCKGLYLPTLTTAGILSVTSKLTTRDRGRIVDLIGFGAVRWSGVAWTDLEYQFIIPEAYGAIGDGVTNDTAAIVLALAASVASGVQTILFSQAKTYLVNSRNGGSTIDAVTVPSGTRLLIDGTLTSTTGNTINLVAAGSIIATSRTFGTIKIAQGVDSRFFQVQTGTVEFSNLRFVGAGLTPSAIFVTSATAGTLDSLVINNCSCEGGFRYFFAREQSAGSTQAVLRTRISNCTIRGISNGSAILINAISGLDRDILISNLTIDTVSGDSSGDSYSGFGIAVAGYSGAAYTPGAPTTRVSLQNVKVNSVRGGIHIEYCNNATLENITVDDISYAYYPAGSETFGVIVYGTSDLVLDGIHVSNVTRDQINAWGVGVRYVTRNAKITNVHCYNASMIFEQQVQSGTVSGIPPFELTTSSVLHIENCSTINGNCNVYAVANLILRNNSFVGPLSFGNFSVSKYRRAANVAYLTIPFSGSSLVNGGIGVVVGDVIQISGVGVGFDAQFATVTALGTPDFTNKLIEIAYSNAGANVALTAGSGTINDYANALMVDCNSSYAISGYTSIYRLSLTIENNLAETVYGGSSFTLRNLSSARFSGNINSKITGNNFGISNSLLPTKSVNRTFSTTNAAVPTGIEYAEGDEVIINLGAGATRSVCSSGGYLGPAGATFITVSALGGTIKKNAGASWAATLPAFSYGEKVFLANGGNSIVGLVQKVDTSGADEILTLVDPATAAAIDLTSLGGSGTIIPNAIATFLA